MLSKKISYSIKTTKMLVMLEVIEYNHCTGYTSTSQSCIFDLLTRDDYKTHTWYNSTLLSYHRVLGTIHHDLVRNESYIPQLEFFFFTCLLLAFITFLNNMRHVRSKITLILLRKSTYLIISWRNRTLSLGETNYHDERPTHKINHRVEP